MTHCLSCGAETSNGLVLCELCQGKAQLDLEFLPVYFRNLARWRPGRAGSRDVPGSRVLYDGTVRGAGTGDRISDRLDEVTNSLTTWARALVDDRPHFPRPLTWSDAVLTGDLPDAICEELSDDPARTVAALCTAFSEHLTSTATLDWCGEFVRDLSQHEALLGGLTQTLVPGWYAGSCRQPVDQGECGAATYVVPGLTWVTCGRCGTTTAARDHLEVILFEARGWVARPKRLAEALVALVDTEPSVPRLYTRIRQWAFTGDIQSIRRTEREYSYDDATDRIVLVEQEVGHARYRMGEVLDQVLRDTRALRRAQAS